MAKGYVLLMDMQDVEGKERTVKHLEMLSSKYNDSKAITKALEMGYQRLETPVFLPDVVSDEYVV